MTRKEFIRICGLFGIGLPVFSSCIPQKTVQENLNHDFDGEVIIIGAGAGGLSTAYFLNQLGVKFKILEASDNYGGRIRVNKTFSDFHIPLGAEWIETNPEILSEIINDKSVQCDLKTVRDFPDYKFVNSSWFNFFERFIVPSIEDHIIYNTPVKEIDYSGERAIVKTKDNELLFADKVVCCVPLKILQLNKIDFHPELPTNKIKAINDSRVWDGFKAFFKFSDQFYNEGFEKILVNTEEGQKIYYDAAYGQTSLSNIIGLFAVGEPVKKFNELSEDELKATVLKDLDEVFSEKTHDYYLGHMSQNWQDEEYIQGGYLTDYCDWRIVQELGKPVNNVLFFTGGEFTDGEDWVSVHAAARAAKKTVTNLINH